MAGRKKRPQDIDGNRAIYGYLQKELQAEDPFLFQMFTARLVVSLGVWFHPDTYRDIPIVYPHAVRDAGAQTDARGDMRHTADANGYLRDDNSIVKNLRTLEPRLTIESPRKEQSGRGLGAGWTSSHVWRVLKDGSLASRHPCTNTFLPNLVWLPTNISALSDREGSFVQQYLQATSIQIYREVKLASHLQEIIDATWDSLTIPLVEPASVPPLSSLNFFSYDRRWTSKAQSRLVAIHEAIKTAAEGVVPPKSKALFNKYAQTLAALPQNATVELLKFLETYTSTWVAVDQDPDSQISIQD